jgi:hypothetical protein
MQRLPFAMLCLALLAACAAPRPASPCAGTLEPINPPAAESSHGKG